MLRRHFLFAALFLSVSVAFGQKQAQPKTVRVLTVGNSFSRNATHYLGDIAKAKGDTLILHEANVGGASFELHWGKVLAFEKDASDKAGLYGKGKSLREELTAEPWDFVTIQQASIKSHDLSTYRPFATQLAEYIRKHAPSATLAVHQTWAYRVDDPRFKKASPAPSEPKSQEEMYRGLRNAYETIASELKAVLLPVGDAFWLADTDPQWGYKPGATPFDPLKAAPNQLPEQKHSLHVGWALRRQRNGGGERKLGMDGHHANMAGEYLGACVWYEVLFGRSVENCAFFPEGLDPEYARFLRATAHRAVTARAAAR